MASFKQTLFHALELVIVLAVVWGVSLLFELDNQLIQGVVVVVLAALAKLVRVSEKVPVKDYVNG